MMVLLGEQAQVGDVVLMLPCRMSAADSVHGPGSSTGPSLVLTLAGFEASSVAAASAATTAAKSPGPVAADDTLHQSASAPGGIRAWRPAAASWCSTGQRCDYWYHRCSHRRVAVDICNVTYMKYVACLAVKHNL